MITDLVACLNNQDAKGMLRQLNNEEFINLDFGRLLESMPSPRPQFVLWKYPERNPLFNADIESLTVSVELPLGRLHQLSSSGILWAFVIELPQCYLECDKAYMAAVTKVKPTFRGAQPLYRSKDHISLFGDEEGLALMAVRDKPHVL